MPTREDGEFEVVLGNKQLFSVLFVFIVLLGVFFAMGFLAGRSTSSEASSLVAATDPPPAASSAKQERSSRTDPERTPPARSEAPAPSRKERTPASAPAAPAGTDPQPAPGRYLQAAAMGRRDAEAMVALLKRSGMPGALAVVPTNPDLFRVLVGPLGSKEEIAETRESLKQFNIDKPYVVDYK